VTPLWNCLVTDLESPDVLICLSSIFWRESWKYEERGFRYCQHDLGHALASLSLAAASFGWTASVYALFPDRALTEYLGLEDTDERPLALLGLWPNQVTASAAVESPDSEKATRSAIQVCNAKRRTIDSEHLAALADNWSNLPKAASSVTNLGTPNQLSENRIQYDPIDNVYVSTSYSIADWQDVQSLLYSRSDGDSTVVDATAGDPPGQIVACSNQIQLRSDLSSFTELLKDASCHKTIRVRRSAVDMDGKTGISKMRLEYILRCATAGFTADFQKPRGFFLQSGNPKRAQNLISLYLYIHRVEGLEPGLYYFDRHTLMLSPLVHSDQKETAKSLSCFQDIADSAFTVSMIADFERGYALYGERCYRLVHYEAGYIGQLLYLATCSLGFDSTGIGCFLDDAINNYLVLSDGREVVYNFTCGRAVQDERLTTLPSYPFSAVSS
ncbi:MAG: nitroreductase family protein, partial [Cyanobacteria bacterium]|nr:nitroreductase family protein [Cyanobacteriota bacterium]